MDELEKTGRRAESTSTPSRSLKSKIPKQGRLKMIKIFWKSGKRSGEISKLQNSSDVIDPLTMMEMISRLEEDWELDVSEEAEPRATLWEKSDLVVRVKRALGSGRRVVFCDEVFLGPSSVDEAMKKTLSYAGRIRIENDDWRGLILRPVEGT